MKHLLLTTIAAVVLLGCGPRAKGADVNAQLDDGSGKRVTPLDMAIQRKKTETVDLLRKHGGKTGEELKAEGK